MDGKSNNDDKDSISMSSQDIGSEKGNALYQKLKFKVDNTPQSHSQRQVDNKSSPQVDILARIVQEKQQ